MTAILRSKPLLLLALVLAGCNVFAQPIKKSYDQHLADSLGADEYGMKQYVLVILKTGSAKADDTKARDSIFGGHMRNIQRLANEGKLVLAGPLYANDRQYEGIFIFNVKTTNEAKALLQTDPAVSSKLLDAELYGWYGPACLPMFLPYFEKTAKKSF